MVSLTIKMDTVTILLCTLWFGHIVGSFHSA